MRLQVADLGRSLDYHQQVLGLHVHEREGAAAALGVAGGERLVELHELPGAVPVPRRGRLGLYHFAILLPERAALGRFVRHLAELGVPAGMADHLVSEAIYLWDPDGLGIEVYADRPRSDWRYDGGQLAMSSDPLDLDDLAAAADRPWDGAPAGTTMGHVHLSVADLGRAEGFYHSALGFEKTVWSYPGALFLAAGGYHHHLGLNTWSRGAPPPGARDARLLEWTLLVPSAADADRAAASLTQSGFQTAGDPGDRTATDPWGTTVRVRAGGRS